MNFHALHRASIYVMLTLATLVLSIDATVDNKLAMLYPPAVAIAGVSAFFLVDRRNGPGLPRGLANGLGAGTFLLTSLEIYSNENNLVLALGHWLVYLQLIQMFRKKTVRDDWYLILLGVVQVVVGGFMSQSDREGIALVSWAVVTLWVLGLFYLRREALRNEKTLAGKVFPSPKPEDPYPGLINPAYVFATMLAAGQTLLLGGLIFLVGPRSTGNAYTSRGKQSDRQHLTGFSEVVRLGQLGEILESDDVVMTVRLTDENSGQSYDPPTELLWRGVTLVNYDRGRWERFDQTSKNVMREARYPFPPGTVRQEFRINPNDSDSLFALRPMIRVSGPRFNTPDYHQADGTLHRPDMQPRMLSAERRPDVQPGAYEYDVQSLTAPNLPADALPPVQARELYPSDFVIEALLRVPGDRRRPMDEAIGLSSGRLKLRLREIAAEVVADIPADRPIKRARALEKYLRDEGKFHYSLHMEIADADLDPVEDFLVNRKEGHCEYFASALALLLRSIDIPARMINGFKGGDQNHLSGIWTVRQRHAHSWVEALVGREQTSERHAVPLWLTLDPTPGTERAATLARSESIWNSFHDVGDLLYFIWISYVVGFNTERQEKLIYQPIRELARNASNGFAMMGKGLREAVDWLLNFNTVGSFFGLRGLIVAILCIGTLAILWRLGRRLISRIVRLVSGRSEDTEAIAASVAFYRRVVILLGEQGLRRPSAETPREFARRASAFFLGRGDGLESFSELPGLVVESYYRVRFGEIDLGADRLREIDAKLDELEARLKGKTPKTLAHQTH